VVFCPPGAAGSPTTLAPPPPVDRFVPIATASTQDVLLAGADHGCRRSSAAARMVWRPAYNNRVAAARPPAGARHTRSSTRR